MRPLFCRSSIEPRVKPSRGRVFKGAFVALFGAAITTLLPAAEAATDARKETLQSINWVENPRDSVRPGRHGELGPYQFRARTWAMHTKRPFSEALNRVISDEIAVIHYEWIKAGLTRAGLTPSTYNIALAWNAGVSAVVRNRAPSASHDYARRVSNLTNEQLRGRQIAAN